MALVSCRECGQQISSEAATCPHCGTPQHRGRVMLMLVGAALILLVCWGIFYAFYWNTPEHRAQQDRDRTSEHFRSR